ncbi:UDP-N-acetylmuramoyl-L-alanine--D-glutamate ligase [Metabacillus arenae]|uniref:UDP-N-acetylmuramoylalanine--D-glutamate ligase n=1 Tax=Metabacillus arenae TaxID=2771434 RepID=A0A926NET8_9BACI|nr:UDP-N-acetylmuramoyl-L-alanine--D-glutamate ligase [Metabacillus arenae]MBD1379931.1 UDP-N-acetylmuramoyl-L-alanine--D-glutamate ligase [Metabacillus arenae]
MKQVNEFKNKQVLVLGLAKSGLAAARLLHTLGAVVTVNDMKPLEDNEAAKELELLGLDVICGSHPPTLLEDKKISFVVKNPGIPYSNPIVKQAFQKNIPVVTEVELAYKISEADIIGITGSNGKTTTTTLVYEMMREGEKKPLIAGNIGTVSCEVAQEATKHNVLVTELSSFQLLGTIEFKPKIAAILNIFDAHLDYHGTRAEYTTAKGKIYENQTEEDIAIINYDDQDVCRLGELSKAEKIYFSVSKELTSGAYIKENTLYFNQEKIIDVKEIVLPGRHNLENILAAVAIVKSRGVDTSAIQKVLTSFSGVKHRLQFVDKIHNRKFYNDSKATNILATTKALQAFNEPTILLAGGLDRGNEFDELLPSLTNVKAIVTFGQTAPKLERICTEAGIEVVKRVDNVEQAVFSAFDLSLEGDVILLSPACASWDQYKTFEQRGDIFINAVHKLK